MMGFKKSDIKQCAKCGKGLMHSGVPIFYKVGIQSMGFDKGALQRTAALEQYFGGAGPGIAIANVMGPDEDLAKSIGKGTNVLICQNCIVEQINLLELIERSKK